MKNINRLLILVLTMSSIPLVCAQEEPNASIQAQQPQTQQQQQQPPQGSNQSRRERIIQLIKMRRQGQNGGGLWKQPQGQGASADANFLDPDGMQEAASIGNSRATARDIAYGPDPLQKLDVYAPPKGTAKGPVILFAHGGGWKRGDKRQHGPKGAAYSSNGIVFISTNYRLAPNAMHPKEIEDIASAFAWVKAHAKDYGGDPNQIYVMGHSAGAHLVDLLATNEKFLAEKGLKLTDIKGCISLDTASLDLTERGALPGVASKMVAEMVTNAFGKDPKVLTEASPLLQLHKGKTYPRFLMICSANRRDSSAAHKAFDEAIHEVGGSVSTIVVPLNHGQISQAAGNEKTDVFAACLAFVQGKPVADSGALQ
ncbi:MAG: alpha/beta hydrolase [Candidatus Obscuribacterales bacterium]